MIAILIVAAAAVVAFWDKIEPAVRSHVQGLNLERRHWLALAMVGVAVGLSLVPPADSMGPTPVPGAVGGLDLRGLFTGTTAAEDAAALSRLCDELACYVEDDGARDRPRLNTGWAIADLRSVARDIRLKGQTFGDRQPAVRDAVKTYLERPEILGVNGGPLGPQDRSRWVAAFRDIARAAELAIR